MEKKYYDLVVLLIKEHKRYSGLEAILDDIVEDVYDHAKLVIDSVKDEEVVTNYLKKVVATSIVTVPKKMNFNTKISHRVILPESELFPEETMEIEQDVVTITEDELELHEETVIEETPNFIETQDEGVFEELPNKLEEEVSELEELSEVQSEQEFRSFGEEHRVEHNETVDKSLVDMMINGVSFQEPELNINENNAEVSEIYENLGTAIDEEIEVQEEVEDETPEISEPIETSEEEIEELNNEVSLEDDFEQVEVLDLDEPSSAFDIEEISESLNTDVELKEVEEDVIEETTSSELESLEVEVLEEADADFVFETEEVLEEQEILLDIEESNFKIPTFECFYFEADSKISEVNDILSEIREYDQKYPEKQILTICDLKYIQKLSVREIADKLGLTTDAVIEVLNEIIEIVKD